MTPAARGRTPRPLGVRIGAVFGVGILIVVLHFTGALDLMQRRLFPPPLDWNQDFAVVEHLRDLAVRDRLAPGLGRDCLLFVINGNDPPQAQRMQVWHKHGAGCPAPDQGSGSPPVLFTMRVDRDHHTVQTDAGSPGRFHALPSS